MIKLIRIYLVLIIAFAASIYIPKYYWMIFEENIRSPFILYSPILKDFLFTRYEGKEVKRFDNSGKELSREEYEELDPLFFYRQAAINGTLPDSLNGIKLDVQEIKLNSINLRIRPKDIDLPSAGLFPLFESRSGRANLELPEEFFRINYRMEFLNCENNEINEKLSETFTASLTRNGFAFPSTGIFGNPTTRKPFDEGYFIKDRKEELYHVKMIEGEPYCRLIPGSEKVEIEYVLVYENELREFYGLVISKFNKLFFISYDDYQLIPVPADTYDRKTDELIIRCSLFYRLIINYKKSSVEAIVTDRSYEKIDSYKENWETNEDLITGRIAAAIFPFTLSFIDENSSMLNFYFTAPGTNSILGIISALILYFAIKFLFLKDPNRNRKLVWADIPVIIVFGLFGLLAVFLVRSEE